MRRLSSALVAAAIVVAGCTVDRPSTPTSPSTVTLDGPADVVLDAGGLLPYPVGGPIQPAVEALTDRYGGPDREISWSPAGDTALGQCPGSEVSALGWGSLYLIAVRDGSGDRFFTWTYGFDHEEAAQGDPRGLDLVTAEGIGLGHSRVELETAYPTVVVTDDADAGITSFVIDPDEPEHLRGLLSGPGSDDVVTYIERVPGCE